MFFFPIGTDRHLKSTPWVNYGLIAINVLVFLFTERQIKILSGVSTQQIADQYFVYNLYLHSTAPKLYQFFSYQFLHADVLHLAGNMVFLYAFGNNVEDRLGKIGYFFFYLAGGVVAGLGHALVETSPVLGASGSVAAVTGVFLALFPMSNITMVYWFVVFNRFEITSMLLILLRVAWDAGLYFMNIGNVAYTAHLAGYGYGFVIGMGLLFSRLLPREPYDMLSLIEHRRRRSQFKKLASQGFGPWDHTTPGEPSREQAELPDSGQLQLMQSRNAITKAIASHDMPAAAKLYAQLLAEDPKQVMSQQHQLDLANQLMAEQRYETAATAYELLLNTYNSSSWKGHVHLILGLIYARYLHNPQRAGELLKQAQKSLDGDDKALALKVLAELTEQADS